MATSNPYMGAPKQNLGIGDMMTGGGEGVYVNGSYSGGGMSGDPNIAGRWGGNANINQPQKSSYGGVNQSSGYTPATGATNQMRDASGNVVSMGGGQSQAAAGNYGPSLGSVATPQQGMSYAQYQGQYGNDPSRPSYSQVIGNAPTSQNLGMGNAQAATPSASLGQNPWLQQQGAALQAQSNQNLKQNILPGIGQGAQAAGMYGSSRQGIAEGQAIGNAQTGLNSALANMYSQSYGQDQQYDLGLKNASNAAQANSNSLSLGQGNLALGNRQADNSYNLGLGQQALGYSQLDSNNQQFGANYGLQAQNYQNQWANNNALTANQIAQTPINNFNQFNSNANAIAGQGGSTSQTNQGNPWLGALGGAQLAYKAFGG